MTQTQANFFSLRHSKIQKYSPTESAKVYDKAVNRKSKVHFNPRQTLNYLKSDLANTDLSHDTKRNIVKQYLDVSIQHYVTSLCMYFFQSQEYEEYVCFDLLVQGSDGALGS